MKNVG